MGCNEIIWGRGMVGILYRTSPSNCTGVSNNKDSHSWSLSEKLGPCELRWNATRNVIAPFTYHGQEGVAYPRDSLDPYRVYEIIWRLNHSGIYRVHWICIVIDENPGFRWVLSSPIHVAQEWKFGGGVGWYYGWNIILSWSYIQCRLQVFTWSVGVTSHSGKSNLIRYPAR
jgi:hypothetical protein